MKDNNNLINISKHFVFHVRMYIKTLESLTSYNETPKKWDLDWNCLIQAHLISTRWLIEFLTKDERNIRNDDRVAFHYFTEMENNPYPIIDTSLSDYKKIMDKQFAHPTLGYHGNFRIQSHQYYDFPKYAISLKSYLINFLNNVPKMKFDTNAKNNALKRLKSFDIPNSRYFHPST